MSTMELAPTHKYILLGVSREPGKSQHHESNRQAGSGLKVHSCDSELTGSDVRPVLHLKKIQTAHQEDLNG